ncbi:MAG TPA: CaiB/BaiF CoA-transferase family protein, partial [Steroidobacteraceae bacterium]|nr:CaiB/BaiF CoA-transferase family protein [Steroidobacteraceae bacterium]
IQAMGGLMSITGPADDEPGGGPQKVGVAVADLMCGMYAVTAILAALFERVSSGRGQYVDLALLDSQVAWLANQNLNYLLTGRPPRRQGTAHPNIVPYQSFGTADGHIMVAVGNDAQFRRFCAVLELDELADHDDFRSNQQRVANRGRLVPLLAGRLRERPTGAWLDLLRGAGVPCGPINDLAQVFSEPQILHRGLRIDLPHPLAGSVPGVGNPLRFSRTPIAYEQAPPLLGADTDDILRGLLGMQQSRLDELRRSGVIL